MAKAGSNRLKQECYLQRLLLTPSQAARNKRAGVERTQRPSKVTPIINHE